MGTRRCRDILKVESDYHICVVSFSSAHPDEAPPTPPESLPLAPNTPPSETPSPRSPPGAGSASLARNATVLPTVFREIAPSTIADTAADACAATAAPLFEAAVNTEAVCAVVEPTAASDDSLGDAGGDGIDEGVVRACCGLPPTLPDKPLFFLSFCVPTPTALALLPLLPPASATPWLIALTILMCLFVHGRISCGVTMQTYRKGAGGERSVTLRRGLPDRPLNALLQGRTKLFIDMFFGRDASHVLCLVH